MAKSFRKSKLENRILQLSNQFLRNDVAEVVLKLVSFTKVDLTNDFSEVKIYWDTFDANQTQEVESVIGNIEKSLRAYLAKELQIKHVPSLSLLYDGQFESEKVISDILVKEKLEGRDF